MILKISLAIAYALGFDAAIYGLIIGSLVWVGVGLLVSQLALVFLLVAVVADLNATDDQLIRLIKRFNQGKT